MILSIFYQFFKIKKIKKFFSVILDFLPYKQQDLAIIKNFKKFDIFLSLKNFNSK